MISWSCCSAGAQPAVLALVCGLLDLVAILIIVQVKVSGNARHIEYFMCGANNLQRGPSATLHYAIQTFRQGKMREFITLLCLTAWYSLVLQGRACGGRQ